MYRMFGYASLVCLMRVHCSLGDYSLALKTVQHLDFSRKVCTVEDYSRH